MSKWRPSPLNCHYVIPDIHGAYDCLTLILDRILPLRKSDGGKDHLVFLGDYIDRHKDSHKVIDTLIELKTKFPEQVTLLMGNHEYMLLQALNLVPGFNFSPATKFHAHRMWMKNGGVDTLLGYYERKMGYQKSVDEVPLFRVSEFIPKEHLQFLQSLQKYHETEEYIFVHGGCYTAQPLSSTSLEEIVWDRSLFKHVLTELKNKTYAPTWDKTIVCGHSSISSNQPIITEKYMMLDCGAPHQLLAVELNSMEAFMASPLKKRLVKYSLTETVLT